MRNYILLCGIFLGLSESSWAVVKKTDQNCPPIVPSANDHSTWNPVIHEGHNFQPWQVYTTTAGYAEGLSAAWERYPSSLICSRFNIINAVIDDHTINASLIVFDTTANMSCSDEGIYQVFITSNCTFNDSIMFNMTFDKNDSCTKDTPPHPEEPKSVIVPEPRPGDPTTLCVNIRFFGNNDITLYDTLWMYGEEGSCQDPNILCEDDGIDESGNTYICNRTIFGNCTFLSNLCISNYSKLQSGNYTTRACPVIPKSGLEGDTSKLELSILGWPELTEWPGSTVSLDMEEVGENLIYGLTNFSYKFLNVTFYNGSKLVANLTYSAEGYKVVVTCDSPCEKATIQLHIYTEGKYKMCYNFTDDVQWTVLNYPPLEYEVPNCTQYTQVSLQQKSTQWPLLGGLLGGFVLLALVIAVPVIIFSWIRCSTAKDSDTYHRPLLRASQRINSDYGSLDSHIDELSGNDDPSEASSDHKDYASGSVVLLSTQPQQMEQGPGNLSRTTYIDIKDNECSMTKNGNNLNQFSEKTDTVSRNEYAETFFSRSSSIGGSATQHSITTDTIVTNIKHFADVEQPQHESSFFTELQNIRQEDLDEYPHPFSTQPHPFSTERPDVPEAIGEVIRLPSDLITQSLSTSICTDDVDILPNAYTYLRFLKADHRLDMLDENGDVEYQLKPADGRAVFDCVTHGTLFTRHFCLVCLTSSIHPDKHTKYYLPARQTSDNGQLVTSPTPNESCTYSDEVRLLPSAVSKANQLGVQFIDPVEIIPCDTLGCDYYNSRHDVKLIIPEGAILPSEGVIDIEFGLAMYGPFKISDGISVRRVSPVVWLCVQQHNFGGFQKDVEITIPHFLHFSIEDAYTYLRFLKADHRLDMLDENGDVEYQLKPADGRAVFDCATHGTLLTRHFCLVCLTSSIHPDKHTKYYLVGGRPQTGLRAKEEQIIFWVCYFLKSCLWTVGMQLNNENFKKIQPTVFMFADGSEAIKLKTEVCNDHDEPVRGRWLLAIESSDKISAKEVDFQIMTEEELWLRESEKLYPPRFIITVRESSPAENCYAVFKFQGATEPIVKRIILAKGNGESQPVDYEQEKTCLERCPTLDDLYCFRDREGRRIKVMDNVQANWPAVALALHMGSAIESIEQSAQFQPASACRKMFTMWLHGSYLTPVTWKTILEALNDSNFIELAKNVRVALISRS